MIPLFVSILTSCLVEGLRIPKRVKDSISEVPSKDPQSIEDWIEQGASEEESGDRWIGSDLAKGLRFFQKAYVSYIQAIRLSDSSPAANVDCYYNSSRLLFHVYNNYVKQEGVNASQLENVNDAITGDYAVIQPLSNVVRAHERALEVASSTSIPLDLLFNTALVYTEQIESFQDGGSDIEFHQILETGLKAQQLFENLLQQQTKSFQKFIQDLNDEGVETESSVEGSSVDGDEFESVESLQPPDIFDTILSGYKLVQALLENISTPDQVSPCTQLIQPFLNNLNSVELDLISTFSESNNSNDMIQSISQEQINDSLVTKNYINGLLVNDLNDLFQIWDLDELPTTPERYMMTSDNVQAFLDRNDINLENQSTSEIYWQALTKMNHIYKLAQDQLQLVLQDKKLKKIDEGIGSLVAQISDIVIARSDIDLQRCQIENYEPAIKNQQILLNNSKTFLKNAVNIANQSGGLRERISEKLLREKRKVDAVLRLCLIEGKITNQELDKIIGRVRWVNELPGLVKTGIFKKFGIENIEIPNDFY